MLVSLRLPWAIICRAFGPFNMSLLTLAATAVIRVHWRSFAVPHLASCAERNASRSLRVENLRLVLRRGYRRRLRMDRVALFVTPPAVAETVTEVLDEPGEVVTLNVVELLPGGTVTLAGTLATEGLLLDSATTVPPAGAAPLRVTVPVEELPALTVVGESVNDDSKGGLMVRAVVLVMPA